MLAAGLLTASGAVFRVRPGNTNVSADGLSYTNAYPSPAPALAAARKGDEIWVAAGTYAGPFTLLTGVSMYGGFAGTEAGRAERNLFTNFAVLDGQLKTNVLTVATGAGNDHELDARPAVDQCGELLPQSRTVSVSGQGLWPSICHFAEINR